MHKKVEVLQRHIDKVRRQLQSSDEVHLVTLRDFTAIRQYARKQVLTWLLSLAAPSQASLVGTCLHLLFYLWFGTKRAHWTAAHANVTKATLYLKLRLELQL